VRVARRGAFCCVGAAVSLLPPLRVEALAAGHVVHEVGFGTALDTRVYLIFDTAVTFVFRVAVDGRDGSTGWVVAAAWRSPISGAVGGLRGALATVDTVGVAGAAAWRTVRFQRALWGGWARRLDVIFISLVLSEAAKGTADTFFRAGGDTGAGPERL